MEITKELLSEVLKINVTEVYRRKSDNELRMKTYSCLNDGRERNSDIPVPDLEKLSFSCKRYAHGKKYRIESNPLTSKLYKLDGKDWILKDTCVNSNFDNPNIYDPMLDIMVCQSILNIEADNADEVEK